LSTNKTREAKQFQDPSRLSANKDDQRGAEKREHQSPTPLLSVNLSSMSPSTILHRIGRNISLFCRIRRNISLLRKTSRSIAIPRNIRWFVHRTVASPQCINLASLSLRLATQLMKLSLLSRLLTLHLIQGPLSFPAFAILTSTDDGVIFTGFLASFKEIAATL